MQSVPVIVPAENILCDQKAYNIGKLKEVGFSILFLFHFGIYLFI